MSLNPLRNFLIVSLIALFAGSASALDVPWFHETDPLSPRDEWGLFHQSKTVYPTDYAPRPGYRSYYYSLSRLQLLADPAYVAALQNILRSRGYYCGPINGIMSQSVSDAIARMQKNYVQRVDGELTVAVRRALFLP